MYFQIGPEKIILDFNDGITVRVGGPESSYLVECIEYRKNDHCPVNIESKRLTRERNIFHLPIEFFFDFEIKIYKLNENYGLQNFYSHRFNDYGKMIKFILEPENLREGLIWIESIKNYVKKRGCELQIVSSYPELEYFSETRFKTRNLYPYKTYRLGRYPKTSTDWNTLDPRKEGLIWYGNWKTFWSYQHPRDWKDLNSEEIVKDILGL